MAPSTFSKREWFDYDTAPDYLGISRRATQRLVADHKIGVTRLGNRTLFSQEQLDAYIAACTIEPRRK